MTFTKTFQLEMDDVRAFRLTCEKCKATVTFRPDGEHRLSENCPNCHKEWLPDHSIDRSTIAEFIRAVLNVRKLKKDAACRISIEIDPPS